jgi:predicted nucleotidyltransferase
MKYGLTNDDFLTLKRILGEYPEIIEVWLFGSRANDNYHAGSDVDLAVMNPGVPAKVIRQVLSDLEDSNLPYFVDLINYPELKHPGLKEQISRNGRLFYSKVPLPVVQERKTGYKEKGVK